MTFTLTQHILQWPLFRRYGCWQVLTILLVKADECGRVSASCEYIESLTGMSHTVVHGILRTFQEENIIKEEADGKLVLWLLPEGAYDETTKLQSEVSTPRSIEVSPIPSETPKPRGIEASRFHKPTVSDVAAYIQEKGFHFEAETFWNFYESKGWMVGKNHMKKWKSACVTFEKRYKENTYAKPNNYQQQRDAARQLFVGAEQAVAAQQTQGDVITYGVAATELGIVPS